LSGSKHVSADFAAHWQSVDAKHTERHHFPDLNLWRDWLPGGVDRLLGGAEPGQTVSVNLRPGEWLEGHDRYLVHRIRRSRFREVFHGIRLAPALGRFYPRTLVAGVGDTFEGDMRPFRLTASEEEFLTVDFNRPMAGVAVTVEARLNEVLPPSAEHGGRANDVPQLLTGGGPGMQARLPRAETDFFREGAFDREDAGSDPDFYGRARLVLHLDTTAVGQVTNLYRRLLKHGARVLDLMSSWRSHLPEEMDFGGVTGLGLNAEELADNPVLTERLVHDLNANPALPWEDAAFDAVVCTVSVEYLTRPLEGFAEVARVIRPGGVFALTFSDRWFPSKVIRLWTELHPFERMGLVLAYLRHSGLFTDLRTESVRNLPRPEDDKYAGMRRTSDPVFAVWACRAS
jgi:FKBP-type peptidyl-prolyl cis-trans isomerase 2